MLADQVDERLAEQQGAHRANGNLRAACRRCPSTRRRSPGSPSSGAARRARRRAARSSTSTASRRPATTGCRSSSATGGLAPDLPGFGRSGKRGDGRYTLDGYADWLERFLEHAGIDRVRLVVHDWGAVAPRARPAAPRARRAPGGPRRGPAAGGLPLAPPRARVAPAAARRGGDGRDHAAGVRLLLREASPRRGRCPTGSSTRSWPTSTRARSARSCASTAPRRRARWPRPARASATCAARRSSSGASAIRTSPPRFAEAYAARARRPGRGAAPARRRALAVASTGPTLVGHASPSPRDCRVSAAARARRRPPAWWLAAAAGGAVPADRPAERRPRRADLPRRPVRGTRVRALGQRLVRRPPPARLQRAVPAARRRCSARASSARSRPSPRRGASSGWCAARFGARGPRRRAVVRRRRPPTSCVTGRLTFVLGVALGARRGAGARARAHRARRARSAR